ncbi:MAG: SAM-dependent methyltransferase [Gammaproteobacteria bacterium RBG_16_57_12]|nr:MAG: SAM-dependent methyltransferase [Gammaproteobacteria bacterium RBG_16_57_12]
MELAPLRLKKDEDRRLRAGHLWVFSNEVDTQVTPLSGFTPGQAVAIQAANGKPLGNGYVNPASLICARLVSRDPHYQLNQSLLVHRLNIALALRESLFDKPCYRLVYGEGDGLPGLVVDRFNDVLVAQITTAGMEQVKEAVIAALDKVLRPRAIVLRNDSGIRALEGLDSYVATALGEAPDQVPLEENHTRFEAPVLGGQKTGWFYDHRMNRARMQHYVRDRRVLDVFSYIGGWGGQAATAGARQVTCIDASEQALDRLHHNARLNQAQDKIDTICGDAFDALKALREEQQKYEVVILDPPAFIKRKKDLKEGLLAYQRINQLAMQLVAKDGILISASCSFQLERPRLREAMQKAARHLDRNLQILEQGHQGPDHPVHPAIPETDYLKAYFTRLLHD